MTKRAFEKIAAGMQDAIAYVDGTADRSRYVIHVPEAIDVKKIRKRLHLTQDAFAERFGFTQSQVREWEQHRSAPPRGVRAYLKVIERDHEAVERALAAA